MLDDLWESWVESWLAAPDKDDRTQPTASKTVDCPENIWEVEFVPLVDYFIVDAMTTGVVTGSSEVEIDGYQRHFSEFLHRACSLVEAHGLDKRGKCWEGSGVVKLLPELVNRMASLHGFNYN
jgi:hypothetical protein